MTIADGFVRATANSFGGALRSQLTVFGNVSNSNIWEAEGCFDAFYTAFNCRSGYRGARTGAEYQGDLKLGALGGLTLGARSETESASTSQSPDPFDGSFTPIRARQTTNSLFAEHRLTLGDRLDVTLGGRIDAIEGAQTFETWRATAAYRIDETGTKLRASVGTGDKAATLYQRFSQYGYAGLAPEQSFGFDAGIDQKLSAGASPPRRRSSTRATAISSISPTSPRARPRRSIPTAAATTTSAARGPRGVELSADAIIAPDVWRARASYTYLDARDLDTQAQLLRRPRNKGALSLIYDGVAKLELESRLTLVGSRLDYNYPTNVTLAPYAKLDFLANYKFNDNFAMFGRVENVTDAHYEEVYNYGTAGRSYYAGITYNW